MSCSPDRRVVVFGVLWLSVSAALLAPGCYGRNCEPGFEVFGVDAGQGTMIDENTWESSPIDGEWLWYPRQRTYSFEVPALGGRTPVDITPSVSATLRPNKDIGGNSVLAAGNIALRFGVGPNRFAYKNDTCSDYYLRVVVDLPPFPPAGDSGRGPATETDAGTADAEAPDSGDDAGDGG
jgi:hypothetical protein